MFAADFNPYVSFLVAAWKPGLKSSTMATGQTFGQHRCGSAWLKTVSFSRFFWVILRPGLSVGSVGCGSKSQTNDAAKLWDGVSSLEFEVVSCRGWGNLLPGHLSMQLNGSSGAVSNLGRQMRS